MENGNRDRISMEKELWIEDPKWEQALYQNGGTINIYKIEMMGQVMSNSTQNRFPKHHNYIIQIGRSSFILENWWIQLFYALLQ